MSRSLLHWPPIRSECEVAWALKSTAVHSYAWGWSPHAILSPLWCAGPRLGLKHQFCINQDRSQKTSGLIHGENHELMVSWQNRQVGLFKNQVSGRDKGPSVRICELNAQDDDQFSFLKFQKSSKRKNRRWGLTNRGVLSCSFLEKKQTFDEKSITWHFKENP